MCNLSTSIRAPQIQIFKQVWKNLGVNIIGQIPEDAFLEGGDFMTPKNDLSMMGIGMRSNMQAAFYLMKNDLLGTKYFAMIIDQNDIDQQRMHLDCYFNVLNENSCVLLDFHTIPKYKKKNNLQRYVNLYEKIDGKYQMISSGMDFRQFLIHQGFTNIISVNDDQQCEYMINFLHLGNNTILTPHPQFIQKIQQYGLQLNVEYVPFQGVTRMYGSIHCATQVLR